VPKRRVHSLLPVRQCTEDGEFDDAAVAPALIGRQEQPVEEPQCAGIRLSGPLGRLGDPQPRQRNVLVFALVAEVVI